MPEPGNPAGDRKPGARLVTATVLEERPSAIYLVVLEGQQRVLAHLVGIARRNFVRLVPGDRVEVELAPHDPTRGRITRRVTGEKPTGEKPTGDRLTGEKLTGE